MTSPAGGAVGTMRACSLNSHSSTVRLGNDPDIRLFSFRRYLIIYRPIETGDGIELIRLLHAARDYPSFFDD
ncbi:type II toxin-antitoxin system RelE/ParE family toxin [Rhizobium sp. SG2393]|uniref:type II toxin-antitoxin system RelE/ParE family toxin n=1 Tax=Rhizobium sp. SG2393 TaxID=3276279 RepID=UPI00366F5880